MLKGSGKCSVSDLFKLVGIPLKGFAVLAENDGEITTLFWTDISLNRIESAGFIQLLQQERDYIEAVVTNIGGDRPGADEAMIEAQRLANLLQMDRVLCFIGYGVNGQIVRTRNYSDVVATQLMNGQGHIDRMVADMAQSCRLSGIFF